MHSHDFAECFWVVTGEVRHTINGIDQRLGIGECVFIRPRDAHEFRPIGRRDFAFVNVAFPRPVLAHARRRYAVDRGDLFWKEAALPDCHELRDDQLHHLETMAQRLVGSGQTEAAIDRFLLDLLGLFEGSPIERDLPAGPGWLREAIAKMREPDRLVGGVREFVRLAGRSPEHVARTTRHVTGMTPSRLVNEIRLEHAARRLLTSDVPILDLALDCGFGEASHFHRLFREKYATSPLKYRRRQAGTIL